MGKILIICYACANFGPVNGEWFRITPEMLGQFVEAPEWITETLLFRWMLNDGTVKVAEKHISKEQGENDPYKGVAADGKDEKVSEAKEEEIVEKVTKTRTRKKKDDAE